MKLSCLFFSFLFFVANSAFSQSTILNTNPPSVKWEQIKTPYFRVIYDVKYEDEAQRTANILETIYEPAALSLNKFPRRRSTVILQNQSTISNGFVAMAPRRSEFNTYPSQQYYFQGNMDWMELLSIHEFRHIVQYEKSITGFNRVLYYMFGQGTLAAFANFAVPDWFWEGDAVITETALSNSGRGRAPYFSMAFRANLLELGPFSYNKQYLRSFRTFVPDHYTTGYFFAGYLRQKHGAGVFDHVTTNAWNWSFVPFTFSNSLKKHTGKFLVKSYKEFITSQEETWRKDIETLGTVDYEGINARKSKIYTNYRFPSLFPDGSLLVLKDGLADIQTFVKIDNDGKEKKEFIPGFINPSGRISTNGRQLVWNEFRPDLRWDARMYSNIKLYDFETGKIEKVTGKGRYSSAAISPDGTKIATIETDEAGRHSLKVLNPSGEEIHRFEDPDNAFYLMPDWDAEGRTIVAVKLLSHQKSVVKIDPERKTEEVVFEVGDENIGYPKIYNQYLFYNSPYNGIDNIYLYHLESKKHYQVTNARYGAFNPEYDPENQVLYFNNYQALGFEVSRLPINLQALEEKKRVKVLRNELVETLTRQENHEKPLEEITDYQFPIEKYPKLKGIINPHSWGITLGSNESEYNVFVASKDVISTTQINGGYTYNLNENAGRWDVSATYQGWFPIVDFNFLQGERRVVEELLDTARGFRWDESAVELGLRLPLTFTNSKYSEGLTLGVKGGFHSVKNYPQSYPHEPDLYQRDGNLHSLNLSASYARLLKRNPRDINSKFGQRLRMFLLSTPYGGDYQSTLFAADGTLYFPGLFRHHSLFFRGGYQWEDKQNYTFRSPLVFPRGHIYASYDQFYSFSANYTLPLIYPDLALGPFLYIQRLRANVFYDYGYGVRDSFFSVLDLEKEYHSVGVDLMFDFNVMRFLPRISMGVRNVYLPQTKEFVTTFLIGSLGN